MKKCIALSALSSEDSLVNVGQKVAEALAKKADLYTRTYTVYNTVFTIADLFKMTGCLDVGGYTEEMKFLKLGHCRCDKYVFRRSGQNKPYFGHKTMLESVYPCGLMTYCATIQEALNFVGQHRGKVRKLLKNGHRLVFVGDTGRSPVKHVGFIYMKRRRICFGREFVTDRTEYQTEDLFLTRHLT